MSDIASRHMENPEMPGNSPVDLTAQQQSKSTFFKKISTIGAGGKQYFDQVDEVKLSTIQHELEVGNDKEKLVAMKRLLAVCFSPFFSLSFFILLTTPHTTQQMISKGRDVAAAFPNVVKCVINKNAEVRKLVYMFLVHYAEVQPQEALLAINSLQKAMTENNQHMRANALRCMSNIRVKEIAQLFVVPSFFSSKKHKPLFSHSPFLPF